MKIAIITNEETMERCTGAGCFKAFIQKKDAFTGYPDSAEIIAFTHSGGDIDRKIERLIENEVDTVHLSSCVRSKYPDYEALAVKLSRHFNVVGYTHGGPEGKTRRTVNISKNT